MRYIHAVGVHEKFVASGTYLHFQDNIPTGTLEHWNIHELPDGAWLIRVDDDWREQDGSSVLIEAWRSPVSEGGKIERFDIHAFGGKTDPIKELRTSFRFEANRLELGRSLNKNPREHFEMELPEDYIVSPESLIFGGYEAVQIAALPVQKAPIASYLPTFFSDVAAFRPVVHQQTAVYSRDEIILLNDKPFNARHFQQGNSLDEIALLLWIDPYDILLKFKSADEHHSAVLTGYARRPDPNQKTS